LQNAANICGLPNRYYPVLLREDTCILAFSPAFLHHPFTHNYAVIMLSSWGLGRGGSKTSTCPPIFTIGKNKKLKEKINIPTSIK
jgi:hypothetical protein